MSEVSRDRRGQPGPELHRLDPSLVTQSVYGLPDAMARHVRALADHEAGRFHAREPFRRGRTPGMGRRGDPFLRESAQAGGLVRRRGRQMGEDSVGRGIEPLPAVPPRHAKGLGKVHLSIWKT